MMAMTSRLRKLLSVSGMVIAGVAADSPQPPAYPASSRLKAKKRRRASRLSHRTFRV
jgi:hypothetical protein